jgi:hypothetical protein
MTDSDITVIKSTKGITITEVPDITVIMAVMDISGNEGPHVHGILHFNARASHLHYSFFFSLMYSLFLPFPVIFFHLPLLSSYYGGVGKGEEDIFIIKTPL